MKFITMYQFCIKHHDQTQTHSFKRCPFGTNPRNKGDFRNLLLDDQKLDWMDVNLEGRGQSSRSKIHKFIQIQCPGPQERHLHVVPKVLQKGIPAHGKVQNTPRLWWEGTSGGRPTGKKCTPIPMSRSQIRHSKKQPGLPMGVGLGKCMGKLWVPLLGVSESRISIYLCVWTDVGPHFKGGVPLNLATKKTYSQHHARRISGVVYEIQKFYKSLGVFVLRVQPDMGGV